MCRISQILIAACFAVPAISAYSQDTDSIPEPVLAVWEQRWTKSVDKLVSEVAIAHSEEYLSGVDSKKKSAFIEDVEQVFLDELAWGAKGKATVEEILRNACGTDLLNKISPYHSGGLIVDEVPERLRTDYVSCSIDVDLHITTTPAYAMLRIARVELPSLFRRHGINPNSAGDRLPDLVDWTLIESAYGQILDAIEALAQIEDPSAWRMEVKRLQELIEADSTIASLRASSKHFFQFQDSRELEFGVERQGGNCSSITGAFWNNNQMMVCGRRGKDTAVTKTLLYRRTTGVGGGSPFIEVHFGYNKLVERFDSVAVRKITTGAEEVAKTYDDYLLGVWHIEERLTRTVGEERHQTGKLIVGPRLSFGTYAVRAEFVVDSRLRREDAKFADSECELIDRTCQYGKNVSGELRIVNSKVRIVFDDAKWGTDVLTVYPDTMIGRNNNFGTTVRLRREATTPRGK